MNLYVMRHGLAAESSTTGRDRDRPLTPEGVAGVGRVARALLEHRGAPLPRLIASPYLRAQETAETVSKIALAPNVEIETSADLAPDEPLPTALLRDVFDQAADTLLVGHHPMVIVLLRHLAKDVADLPLGLHPGMLVGLSRSGPTGPFRVTITLKP